MLNIFRQIIQTLSASMLSLLIMVPSSAQAISYHLVGKIEQASYYGGNKKVAHPDSQSGGKTIKDGSRYVWNTANNPSLYSWVGPSLTVKAGVSSSSIKRYQKACYIVKGVTNTPAVHFIILGKKEGASSQHTIKSTVMNIDSSTYKPYCLTYALVGKYSDLDWDAYVQSGQVKIDRIDLYQGGTSGASIIDEVAANPSGAKQ